MSAFWLLFYLWEETREKGEHNSACSAYQRSLVTSGEKSGPPARRPWTGEERRHLLFPPHHLFPLWMVRPRCEPATMSRSQLLVPEWGSTPACLISVPRTFAGTHLFWWIWNWKAISLRAAVIAACGHEGVLGSAPSERQGEHEYFYASWSSQGQEFCFKDTAWNIEVLISIC